MSSSNLWVPHLLGCVPTSEKLGVLVHGSYSHTDALLEEGLGEPNRFLAGGYERATSLPCEFQIRIAPSLVRLQDSGEYCHHGCLRPGQLNAKLGSGSGGGGGGNRWEWIDVGDKDKDNTDLYDECCNLSCTDARNHSLEPINLENYSLPESQRWRVPNFELPKNNHSHHGCLRPGQLNKNRKSESGVRKE